MAKQNIPSVALRRFPVNKIAHIGLICIGLLLSLAQVSAQSGEHEVGQLAVTVLTRGENPEIYLINADGTDPVNLTENEEWDADPQWSPDGERILFTRGYIMDDGEDIYMMHADGSDLVNLTNSPGNDNSPTWSPDGTQLAFNSSRSGNTEIYTIDLTDEDYLPVQITESEQPVHLDAWLPDGSELLYDTSDGNLHGSINTMTLDGAEIGTIYSADGIILQPLLSPDGSKVLFVRFEETINLYIMNIDGSDVRNLLADDIDTDPFYAWSPDSSQIAFGIREASADHISNIYIIDVDGSNLHALTDFTDEGFCTGISWSPDGTQLAFSRDSERDVYIVDVDGKNLVNLTADSDDHYFAPVWRPSR
jgi:Tol biopolymer transport system component